MELQTIILIGRSGAGKGMQSGMLQKYLKETSPETPVLYLETGSYFRKYIKEQGCIWENARIVQEKGGRQPDFLAVWIWAGIFIEKIQGGEHLIFDGMPRSAVEARLLDTAFSFCGRKNVAVVFLNVSEKWAEDHLRSRGREDDLKPEVVAKRLAFFNADVVPAIEYYRETPTYRFLEINGEQTPDEVFGDIRVALGI